MIDLHARPPAPPPSSRPDRAWRAAGALVLVLLVVLAAGLVALVALAQTGRLGDLATPPADPDGFAVEPREAPPLDLLNEDAEPFSLPLLRGAPVLVFFGYTHCPDVCPATVGIVNEALAEAATPAHVVFVSVDPERDDPPALKSYLRYLPEAYTALTGTPALIRQTADAWGVTYAKIETGSAGGYAMAHTADLYLLDAAGRIRAVFPFGTEAAPIAAALGDLERETAAATPPPGSPVAPTAAPPSPPPVTPAPTHAMGNERPMEPVVASTSVWAGGATPVVLTLFDEAGARLANPAMTARAQLTDDAGTPVGGEVAAAVVTPPGTADAFVVPTVDVPAPGDWGLRVVASDGATTYAGWTRIRALDPGDTPALGQPAPSLATPTLRDVGGLAAAITTAPQPDLRLSETSTVEATAAGRPYVLLVDSYTFRVSPACGRALVMARVMLDRWPDTTFIHLEPYEYSLVSSTPVLAGSLQAPVLNRYARAWGLGTGPWSAIDVPWVFVVDGDGIVRAKATGVLGSPDVDVILAMLAAEG